MSSAPNLPLLIEPASLQACRADPAVLIVDLCDPARYAAGRHVLVARQGVERGPVDEALKAVGLERQVATTVGGFSTALALVRSTDLIDSVPERHTGLLRAGLFSFALPVPVPEITVSMLWHPRLDGDPAHRWLRGVVRGVCGAG